MSEEDDKDFEIVDSDNYRGNRDNQFSYQQLVMRAINKCLEYGSVEMREGYWNEKADKFGNVIKNYVEDSRKKFIETVKSTEMIMIGDIDKDKDAKDNIKKIKNKLNDLFKSLCEKEKRDIETAPASLKRGRLSRGIYFREDSLNKNFIYYQEYIEEAIKSYREIVEELMKLAQRNNYYQESEWTN